MPRLSSLAAQTLQREIFAGEHAASGMLPGQRELAIRLGISRGVLREAVSTLEALGLVRSQPGKGVIVTAGQQRSVTDLPMGPNESGPQSVFQFRAILEPAAASLAASVASEADIHRLQSIQHEMENALDALDIVAASDADLAFHLHIAGMAANPLLQSVIHALEAPIAYSLRLPFADPAEIRAPAAEHRLVLDAICARDSPAAHAAMQDHIVRAAARIGLTFVPPRARDPQSPELAQPEAGQLSSMPMSLTGVTP